MLAHPPWQRSRLCCYDKQLASAAGDCGKSAAAGPAAFVAFTDALILLRIRGAAQCGYSCSCERHLGIVIFRIAHLLVERSRRSYRCYQRRRRRIDSTGISAGITNREENEMAWKTPKIVELPVGMEINMYACAARK